MKRIVIIVLTGLILVISSQPLLAQKATSSKHRSFMNAPTYQSFEEIPYPFAVKKVQIDPLTEIAYVDEGSGSETIIFIHGLGSYLPAWRRAGPSSSWPAAGNRWPASPSGLERSRT